MMSLLENSALLFVSSSTIVLVGALFNMRREAAATFEAHIDGGNDNDSDDSDQQG